MELNRVAALLTIAVSLTIPSLWGQTSGSCGTGAAGTFRCATSLITSASGTVLTITNSLGGIPASFEYLLTGSPASSSIVLAGCMKGGTCVTLDTYTGNAAGHIAPTTANSVIYDYFTVTPTWSGGTSVTFTVNTTLSAANSGSGGGSGGLPSGTGVVRVDSSVGSAGELSGFSTTSGSNAVSPGTVASGKTLTIASGGTLTCASGSTCPGGSTPAGIGFWGVNITPPLINQSSDAFASNNIVYVYPFVLPYNYTVTTYSFTYLDGAGGKVGDVCIYSAAGGLLVNTGGVATTSGGNQGANGNISQTSVALTAGTLYYQAWTDSLSTVQFWSYSIINAPTTYKNSVFPGHAANAASNGVCPSTLGTITQETSTYVKTPPAVLWQ